MRDVGEWVKEKALSEPLLLFSEISNCPICKARGLEVKEYLYEVPYFGKLILSEGTCRYCGYKYSDVRMADAGTPRKIIVKVKGEEELRYLLVKSAMAAIYIPERGYEMLPGPASAGFISTVEGILHRFDEALKVACRDKVEDMVCKDHERWLRRAIEGSEPFTLIICDYEGTSKVVGENVVETELDKECNRLREKSVALLGAHIE